MTTTPRLPLSGHIDLTYRCNNHCRHCWLWLPAGDRKQREELTTPEIERVVLEARALGCRDWSISGGEPMLRPDFPEIFDFITRRARTYSLNTNGTLITPEIARLMKRKGSKMVALYGATAGVHDRVTRAPGSFDAAMRGFALLREAGAGFIVQIVPMRENFHQYEQMVALAESLSPHYRVGAAWLNLSASGNRTKNQSICSQRLTPAEVVFLDPPSAEEDGAGREQGDPPHPEGLLAACALRSEFHIDPYGGMSYCCYIKDPAQRFDLRVGSFQQGWDEYLPSLAAVIQPDDTYRTNCGSCELRPYCRWCPAHARLETGSYTKPVPYLCEIAREAKQYISAYRQSNIRYFQIAGLTVEVQSDLPFQPETFHPALKHFETDGAESAAVFIQHHFLLPALMMEKMGQLVYSKPPWRIFENPSGWVYLSGGTDGQNPHQVVVWNKTYTRGNVYHETPESFQKGMSDSLTFLPGDEVLFAQILSNQLGCYLHSSGVILNGNGLIFLGHSGAGKSTLLQMIRSKGQMLCDERNIIRLWPDGFHLHSTWSYGKTIREVTAGEAPLAAVLFLEKAPANRLVRMEDPREIVRRLPAFVIKPLATAEWWHKTLDLVEAVAQQVPCYRLEFDKSGAVVDLLEQLSLS